MNLLSEIISRLNQRIGVANIFDKQFGLCELNANGNDKAWIHYIGDGQGEVVTNFDAKQGTIFWAKRGKVNISIIDSLKVSGCKKMYQTTFPLTAYAVVRKAHLPCDSEDAQDWIASRVFKLTSGMDFGFKQSIGVMSYEVIPNGYANEIKSLTQNYEWACVSIDIDVQIVSSADDGCYDTCQTGEIPLPPNYAPCTPCLTEVAVDGVTITGNGTEADPLVATGVTAGGTIIVKDEGTTISSAATTVNFTGAGVTSSLTSPGVVEVNISASGTQVNSDWNAVSGVAEILNKPTIPDAQVNSDWNAVSGVSEILNKPTIPSIAGLVPYTGATAAVDLGLFDITAAHLIKDGGVDTQFLKADGSVDNNVYLTSADLPSTLDLFATTSPDPIIGGYSVLVRNILDPRFNTVAVDVSTGAITTTTQLLSSLISDTNVISGNPGLFNITTIGNITRVSGSGTADFFFRIYKRDAGGTETFITQSSNTLPVTNGGYVEFSTTALWNDGIFLSTDRIVIKYYANRIAGGSNPVYQFQFGGISPVRSVAAVPVAVLPNIYLSDLADVENVPALDNEVLYWNDTASLWEHALVDDLVTSAALTKTDDTNVTLTLGGSPTDALLNAVSLTLGWTGTLADARIASAATWNAKQDALGFTPVTNARTLSINGVAYDLSANRSWIIPAPTVWKTTADSAGHSGLLNTVKYTQLISANEIATGDILRLNYRARKTGIGGSQTLRIYVNTTADLSGSPILIGGWSGGGANSSLTNQMIRHLSVKDASNNTEVFFAAGVGVPTDYGLYAALTTCGIDWTVNQYFVFCVQNSNAADVSYGSMYLIEKL
jgi:hypothetical protein